MAIYILGFATDEKTIKSDLKNVTVFPGSAQLFRSGSFSISSGITELVFENVSPFVDPKSIQAKGAGSYVILDVQFRVKQPEPALPVYNNILPPKILSEIKFLQDSLADVSFELEAIRSKIDVLNLEKTLLMNNSLVKGSGGDTIPELKATLEFFRVKLNDINTELVKIRKDEYKVSLKQNNMQIRLNDLLAYNSQVLPTVQPQVPIYQIVVTVSAEAAVSGSMDINYMVNNAGWAPSYDLRANGSDQPMQLIYKANVWQNTGENWDNVKLKLSTITPTANNVKPYLPVFYLGYYTAPAYLRTDSEKRDRAYAADDFSARELAASGSPSTAPADYAYNYTSAVQTLTNVEFDIKLSYSVPSDGKSHMVPVQNKEIPTTYYHYIVPKIESQAFLVAKLTDWETMDLLPGNANIYFDGTFIGETMINPNTLEDTMELALGRDRSIVINRKKLKDEVNSKIIGSYRTKVISYEISIKNNKAVAANIIVQDQIPVSQDQDIKVELVDGGKAEVDEGMGLLTWKYKLLSKESKKHVFTYNVVYDKNKPVASVY
ncbi:MAG: hypothetical protein A2W91_10735 [Bacteroidetes bacterium GWF2_38_335]|nr:MAG: hypothetical protein A2W91_10735 [Bacteroidetes bacterium GWF2_38_335]OFY81822.1 MAG: hypothetical protein A2281_06305 [Bacteroidetes bacterium RIFOXYA12_FULL_38_20]